MGRALQWDIWESAIKKVVHLEIVNWENVFVRASDIWKRVSLTTTNLKQVYNQTLFVSVTTTNLKQVYNQILFHE